MNLRTPVAVVMFTQGCATVHNGCYQELSVVSDPAAADSRFANFAAAIAGGAIGATRQSDQAFVDFLVGAFFAGAGIAIDAMTGAMWQLEPAGVDVRLRPSELP
jgi:hypothetical protein